MTITTRRNDKNNLCTSNASKRMISRNTFNQERVKYLYSESYESLMKGIENCTNKWKDIP